MAREKKDLFQDGAVLDENKQAHFAQVVVELKILALALHCTTIVINEIKKSIMEGGQLASKIKMLANALVLGGYHRRLIFDATDNLTAAISGFVASLAKFTSMKLQHGLDDLKEQLALDEQNLRNKQLLIESNKALTKKNQNVIEALETWLREKAKLAGRNSQRYARMLSDKNVDSPEKIKAAHEKDPFFLDIIDEEDKDTILETLDKQAREAEWVPRNKEGAQTVLIKGATGTCAKRIEGIYDISHKDEDSFGPIYIKRDKKVAIWYLQSNISLDTHVFIGPAENRGSSWPFFAQLICDKPIPLEMIVGSVWNMNIFDVQLNAQRGVRVLISQKEIDEWTRQEEKEKEMNKLHSAFDMIGPWTSS